MRSGVPGATRIRAHVLPCPAWCSVTSGIRSPRSYHGPCPHTQPCPAPALPSARTPTPHPARPDPECIEVNAPLLSWIPRIPDALPPRPALGCMHACLCRPRVPCGTRRGRQPHPAQAAAGAARRRAHARARGSAAEKRRPRRAMPCPAQWRGTLRFIHEPIRVVYIAVRGRCRPCLSIQSSCSCTATEPTP